MIFIIYATIVYLIAFGRIVACRMVRVSGVQFSIGFGPTIGCFNIVPGILLIKAFPFCEYAKMPSIKREDDFGHEYENCQVPYIKKAIISSVTLVVPTVLAVIVSWFGNFDLYQSILRIIDEYKSLYGFGENHVNLMNLIKDGDLTGIYYTLITLVFVNCLPLPICTMGDLLCLSRIPFLCNGSRLGTVVLLSCLVFIFTILLSVCI